jgi:WD40 repeat protein
VRLLTVTEPEEVHSLEFHPDGLMLAVGLKNGVIKIYDMRNQQVIKELEAFKGQGEVTNISFSNKGAHFAATWKNIETAKLFNLRKFDHAPLDIVNSHPASKATTASFDHYGGYLATGSDNSLNIYNLKDVANPVHSFQAHDGIVNIAKFTTSGKAIISGGEDRFLNVFSL